MTNSDISEVDRRDVDSIKTTGYMTYSYFVGSCNMRWYVRIEQGDNGPYSFNSYRQIIVTKKSC